VLHIVPADEAKVAEQNFQRGKLSALEDFLELATELKEFKERNK
jgi:hypothetical protein